MGRVSERRQCPVCEVPILIKNLRQNPSFGTMALCVKKMLALLEEEERPHNEVEQPTNATSLPGETPKRSSETTKQLERTPASALAALALDTPTLTSTTTTATDNTPSSAKGASLSQRPTRARPRKSQGTPSKKSKTSSSAAAAAATPNTLPGRGRTAMVFLTTGLSDDQKMIVSSSFNRIGAQKAILRTNYTSDVTHLISACNERRLCPRTAKYLRGVLEGCHVVSYDWFLASLSANGFVEEAPFWIQGDDVTGVPTEAVRRSLQRPSKSPRLFARLSVFLAGSFVSPTRADVTLLVSAGGGKVLARRPKIEESSSVWIVYDPASLADKTLDYLQCYPNVASWMQIFDCISHYSLAPLASQSLQPTSHSSLQDCRHGADLSDKSLPSP